MGPTCKLNVNKNKIDDMTLIWLDNSISQSDDNYYSMNKLCCLIQNIRTFSQIDRFIKYLNDELNEKIILIVSGSLGCEIIPKIHNYYLIDSIYIFCQNQTKHRLWAKSFNKIQGVFNDIDFLCLHLRKTKLFPNYHLISKKSSIDEFIPLKFVEYLNKSDYQYEQLKEEFLSYYTENEALPVSDVIDRDFDDKKNENIDSCLMYFSSNDNIEKIDLNHSVVHSNTVIPFLKQTDQKYLDNGNWPCLWWIIKNENNFSKMIGFNRIHHLIINTRIIENLDIFLKSSLNNHFNEEHFLVICDLDNPQFYLPKLCQQENIRRIYFHSSLDHFEEYQTIIKKFSKFISILQYSDTLIHMILHDFIFYLIKLAENYQKQNKIKLAKIRYEYALQLQSNLQKFLNEKIQLLKKH